MRYRNKVTGIELDIPCAVSGGDWEEVKVKPASKEEEAKTAATKKPAVKKAAAEKT